MVRCCVPFCKSAQGARKGLSFHQFPNNNELRQEWIKWLEVISREGDKLGSSWIPKDRSVVCGKHFKEEDYSISTTRKILLPNTIPSVFERSAKYEKDANIKQRKRKQVRLECRSALKPLQDDVYRDIASKTVEYVHVNSVTPEYDLYSDIPSGSKIYVTGNTNLGKSESDELHNDTASKIKKYVNSVNIIAKYGLEAVESDPPSRIDIGTQCTPVKVEIPQAVKIKLRRLSKSNSKKSIIISRLRNKVRELKAQRQQNSLRNQMLNLKNEADLGDLKAQFLIEQIEAYGKDKCKFKDSTLKMSTLLFTRSSFAYQILRNTKLLHLPHQKTLRAIIGYPIGDTELCSIISESAASDEFVEEEEELSLNDEAVEENSD